MPGRETWAERVRVAVLEEERQDRGYAGVALRDARALDEHLIEFRFVPDYLDGREVVLVVDGRQRFADDFLADEPEQASLPLKEWPVEEVAWRIFLLGMREPFSASELGRDAGGRWIRMMTS